jgi:tagatose-1,6-bisphosphate aldolase
LTTSETGVVAALAATEDEVLGALDADQRETLYQLLAQATTSHVVDCASAAAELLSNDGC